MEHVRQAGDTVVAHIEGRQIVLTTEERQYVEPSAYCHEAGWWCVSDEDDSLYFVSDDGRIDLHDAETFQCVQESIGVTQEAHDAYWREQAEDEQRRRSSP